MCLQAGWSDDLKIPQSSPPFCSKEELRLDRASGELKTGKRGSIARCAPPRTRDRASITNLCTRTTRDWARSACLWTATTGDRASFAGWTVSMAWSRFERVFGPVVSAVKDFRENLYSGEARRRSWPWVTRTLSQNDWPAKWQPRPEKVSLKPSFSLHRNGWSAWRAAEPARA